jgi:beta-glucosidase
MSHKSRIPLYRGLTATMLSFVCAFTIGYSIADTWRSTVDSVLGTQSYLTDETNPKYVSTYSSAKDLMDAAKQLSIREGAEGTVIMKNENSVLPLAKTAKVGLWGSAAYNPYMVAAGNTDQIKLVAALKDAGMTLDPTLEAIYTKLGTFKTITGSGWRQSVSYTYGPNMSAGDYDSKGFNVVEADPDSAFTGDGGAATNWKASVNDDVAIVVFSRPGGEGSTYRPGIARDNGVTNTKNPLAFSDTEIKVIDQAKATAKKVVVLLNTSCAFEVGPLLKGTHAVDGIAYIGIPNDYQFKGIVQALDGDVNPTGALADTYAISSTSAPAMMNFGGDTYSDYTLAEANTENSTYNDPRWPSTKITNGGSGSFGGSTSYSGGLYIAEAEGIYTGYNYYETRYYDAMKKQGSATSSKGVSQGEASWSYASEVAYSFGHGLSYLPYTETLQGVSVENRANGNVTAKIAITNKGTKAGKFLAQLYVQSPYTTYDKANLVEKSAVQFLSSAKIDVEAGATGIATIVVPSKYLASYDYTKAKTYVLDGGRYYFATGAGSHAAVNNILTAQGVTGDAAGDSGCVKTWDVGSENAPDITTYAVSASGAKISNVAEKVDLNYYLPSTVTYLTRQNWDGTYPVNYNTINSGKGVSIAASSKKDEWIAEMRGQTYTVKTNEPVANINGVSGPKFADITYAEQTNFNDPFWDKLANALTVDEAMGAVLHGGSASDQLASIMNPVVKQFDGPTGFNGKSLSSNNGTEGEDAYFVDPTTEEGAFKPCINSQTLLGSSFSPELAYDWGKLLGNSGLWERNYQIWGAALNYHRSQYNGRNTEYPSEDPMLCNVLGAGIIKGCNELGIICGPKHIGFNDQEYDRSGISVFMNEQKFRETDLRGFEGAIEDQNAKGLMVAFNRLGATNASHSKALLQDIIRKEWNFKGLISTDMMNNKWYFNGESCVMASVTQIADFAAGNSTLSGGAGGVDSVWNYLSVDAVKNDATLVAQARQNIKYQLFAFANSAVLNISTIRVTPSWEAGLKVAIGVSAGLAVISAGLWVAAGLLAEKKQEVA